jgi:hypothetical protein
VSVITHIRLFLVLYFKGKDGRMGVLQQTSTSNYKICVMKQTPTRSKSFKTAQKIDKTPVQQFLGHVLRGL